MDKPVLRIAVLGHTGQGKTTTIAAISKVLSQRYGLTNAVSVDEIENTSDPRESTLSYSTTTVVCETPDRIYHLVDCPGHFDRVKDLLTGRKLADGALLVVDACDGPMPQTGEQVLLANRAGIPCISVFMNKLDLVLDEDFLFLTDMETCEILSAYDFDGDNCNIIHGSALGALEEGAASQWGSAIMELKEELDNIPAPMNIEDRPFLMAVEDSFFITGKGAVATGRVEQGCVSCGDVLEVVGLDTNGTRAKVTGIQMFRDPIETAKPGDNIGLVLAGISRDEIQRGQVLSQPGSIASHTTFNAEVYFLKPEEGGQRTPILEGGRMHFYFRTAEEWGFYSMLPGTEFVLPGDIANIDIEMNIPFAMQEGDSFAMRDGGRTIGIGKVVRIYN